MILMRRRRTIKLIVIPNNDTHHRRDNANGDSPGAPPARLDAGCTLHIIHIIQ